LYTSTPEKDLETFQIAFATPWIKSDELKFYPTAVIPNTPLYDLFKSGEYEPIQDDDLKHIVRTFKDSIIPPYSRIKRLARDFDTNEVVAGANTPNLRQLVMNAMKQEYKEDSQLRKKQYLRLSHALHDLDKKDISKDILHIADQQRVLNHIAKPMPKETMVYTSLSHEEWVIDETIETICV
jgi:elongator complex protein 3